MPIVEIQAGASHVIQIQRKEIHLARQDKQRIKHIIPDVQGYQNRRGSESRTEQRQNDGKKDSYRLSPIHTRRFLERHRNGTDETSDEENYRRHVDAHIYADHTHCGAGQADDLQQHHHSDHGRRKNQTGDAQRIHNGKQLGRPSRENPRGHRTEQQCEEHRRNGNNDGSEERGNHFTVHQYRFEVLQKMPLTWQTHIRDHSFRLSFPCCNHQQPERNAEKYYHHHENHDGVEDGMPFGRSIDRDGIIGLGRCAIRCGCHRIFASLLRRYQMSGTAMIITIMNRTRLIVVDCEYSPWPNVLQMKILMISVVLPGPPCVVA